MIRNLLSIAVLAYIASVVVLNMGFAYVPMIETPAGMLSPMAVLAGLVFVLRDFAQRRAGHGVLVAMVIATGLSYLLADPYVALASAAAFAVAELADYAIYTFTQKPFHQRILLSSLVSTPVDTLVFLFGISAFTVGTFILMVAAKLVAAVVIWFIYRDRELNGPYVTASAGIWDDPDFDHSASSPFTGDAFKVLDGKGDRSKPAPVSRSL